MEKPGNALDLSHFNSEMGTVAQRVPPFQKFIYYKHLNFMKSKNFYFPIHLPVSLILPWPLNPNYEFHLTQDFALVLDLSAI